MHISRLLRSESTWQLLDQAAVSGGNFLTSLLLARVLAPVDFGIFTLLFITLIALNTCHLSFVTYPLTIAIAQAPSEQRKQLSGDAILRSIFVLPILILALGSISTLIHQLSELLICSFAMAFWQLQETTRRTLLASRRARIAVVPDALSYIGQAALVSFIHPRALGSIFAIIGITSMIAFAIQAGLIRPTFHSAFRLGHFVKSWGLGRCILAGDLLMVASSQLPHWSLKVFSGSSSVAGYQALLTLVCAPNPIILSLSNVLTPEIARASLVSRRHARLTMLRFGLRFCVLLIPVFVLYSIFPRHALTAVYGRSSPYPMLYTHLRVLTAAAMLQFSSNVIGAYEAGTGRPSTHMWVQLISAAFLLTVGIGLIRSYSLWGAVISLLLYAALRFVLFASLSHLRDEWSKHRDIVSLTAHSPNSRAG